MGILKWTKPWVLTGGFPEVPFMPVTRYATRMDICLQEKRTEESEKLLVFCKSLLSRHPFNNLNKKFGFRITDVELQVSTSIRSKEERLTKCMQIDGGRLLLFAEIRERFPWNSFVTKVYEHAKNFLKKKDIRVFIQRKFVPMKQFGQFPTLIIFSNFKNDSKIRRQKGFANISTGRASF